MTEPTDIAAKSGSKPILRIGGWIVDADANSIARSGDVRSLQPLSMDILLYLADRPGLVVTNDELIGRFWVGRIVGDDAVHRRIADLRKKLDDDSKHPRYLETISKRGYRLIAPVERMSATCCEAPTPLRRSRSLVAAAVLLFVIGLAAFIWIDETRQRKALGMALIKAEALLSEDRYQEAYLALVPHSHRKDPNLQPLLDEILLPIGIVTKPAGIDIAYRFAGLDWTALGATPIRSMLPRGHCKLRIGDKLYMDATNPGVTLNSAGQVERIIELPVEAIPDEMVFIPGGNYRFGAWGFSGAVDLGGFLVDRHEVSNRDYLEFVEAGGYANPLYWQPQIDGSGGALTWPIIRERFVDRTGNPGPAGWEFGKYIPGEGSLPVVGVSWYEASAFLDFRGKSLPTVYHWLRAALGPMEWKYPFAREHVPQSNVASGSLLPIDRPTAAEVNGAFDMIGNADEWAASDSRGARAVIGSSFRDPAWAYNFPHPYEPLERLDTIGFRGIRLTAASRTESLPGFDLFNDYSGSVRHVSDEVFEGMSYGFDYKPGTVKAADADLIRETESEQWITRVLRIPTGRASDPMSVYFYLPKTHAPPYQAVIYLPPADSWSPGFRSESVSLENYQIDFLPRSGRALIWPVYTGSHERYDELHAVTGAERAPLILERNRRIRDEIGRVIDYLESDPSFDGSKVALIGLSHGAALAPFSLATEPRLQAAVLYSVGIAPPIPVFLNQQNDPNVFWARVRQPTLIINGRYDPLRPHRFILEPLLDLLATPETDKTALLYESGHWPLPRYQMMRDTLDWLDRYLGPVASPGSSP